MIGINLLLTMIALERIAQQVGLANSEKEKEEAKKGEK